MTADHTAVPPGRAPDLAQLSDHELLAAMVADQQAMNLAEAGRLAKLAEFHRRRAADVHARRAAEPHHTMTALRETIVEAAPLLGAQPGRVRADLELHDQLSGHPVLRGLLEAGRIDGYRVRIVLDAATPLGEGAAFEEYADAMGAWLQRHLDERADSSGGQPALVTKTPKQIRNHAGYVVKKLRPGESEKRFARAFTDRHVGLSSTEDGMGYLSVNHDIASLQAADYRITLLAKHLRAVPGETRTLAQLRADLTVDLLLGRLSTSVTTGELEAPETTPTGDPLDRLEMHEVGRWARPIINVTVPVQTLAGLTDDPGTLSGGEVIPAALCRRLAQDPDSTWYRLLTDPATGTAELSTDTYRPSREIWRQVVARDQTCTAPACTMPASACEVDHRVPWPAGETATANLHTTCRSHHQAKHAPGFGLARTPDGRDWLHTGAGFRHPEEQPLRPDSTDWGCLDRLARLRPSAAELDEALEQVAAQRAVLDRSAAAAFDRAQLHADYLASYPEATDEEIWDWMTEENPAEGAPPVLRRGTTVVEAGLHAAQGTETYHRLRKSAPQC